MRDPNAPATQEDLAAIADVLTAQSLLTVAPLRADLADARASGATLPELAERARALVALQAKLTPDPPPPPKLSTMPYMPALRRFVP